MADMIPHHITVDSVSAWESVPHLCFTAIHRTILFSVTILNNDKDNFFAEAVSYNVVHLVQKLCEVAFLQNHLHLRHGVIGSASQHDC